MLVCACAKLDGRHARRLISLFAFCAVISDYEAAMNVIREGMTSHNYIRGRCDTISSAVNERAAWDNRNVCSVGVSVFELLLLS